MTNPEEFKEKFYNNLREVLWRVPCTDKPITAADFDARVGKVDKWPCVISPRGVSKCNSNSELPLGLSWGHNLVITNTIFKHKKHHKTTWMQPRYKHWHLLDYMTVRQVDQNDVLNTICCCIPFLSCFKWSYGKGRDQTKRDPWYQFGGWA